MRVYNNTNPDLGQFRPTKEWLEYVRSKVEKEGFTYSVGYLDSTDYFVWGDEFGLILKSTVAEFSSGSFRTVDNLDIESELIDGFVKVADLDAFESANPATRFTLGASAKVERTIESKKTSGNPIIVIGSDGTDTDLIAVNIGDDAGLPPTTLRKLATDWFDIGTASEPIWFVGLATAPDVALISDEDESYWSGGSNCLGMTVCPMVGSTDIQFITYDENSILDDGGNPLLLTNTSTDLYLSRFAYGDFDRGWINNNSITDIAVTLTTNRTFLSVGIASQIGFDLPNGGYYSHVFLYRNDGENGMVAFIAEMPEPEDKAGLGWVGVDVGASVLII